MPSQDTSAGTVIVHGCCRRETRTGLECEKKLKVAVINDYTHWPEHVKVLLNDLLEPGLEHGAGSVGIVQDHVIQVLF